MRVLRELVDIRPGPAMAGRGAGAQPGDWEVRAVESADIVDDRLHLEGLGEIGVRRGVRTAAHLVESFDLVAAARSGAAKAALVPASAHPERRGRALFIDAAGDYFRSGKAQNFLDPEHVAAIVGAFR
ncbi:MAG: hypothetical protein F4110_09595 [Acidimicrobiaceae bacterium]|nr:hypothetical protein [Acidimicrobiaceae bacterium]MYE97935.1 hypothetical protein [Acidimicrobiaceae bacterium]MYI54216.1 hypothetical protein [Acidimicrobiaceae bacterium]